MGMEITGTTKALQRKNCCTMYTDAGEVKVLKISVSYDICNTEPKGTGAEVILFESLDELL